MCLLMLKDQKRAIKRLFKNRKQITCYKALVNYDNKLYSPAYHHYQWTFGENISSRSYTTLLKNEYDAKQVGHGIHVYTSKKHATVYDGEILVPVSCNLSDVVAVGHNKEAVFTKVYLLRREYDKAIKKLSNNLESKE